MRVEVAAKEVRNRPLSAVLAYTGVLKKRASKLMANGDGMASFHEVIEQKAERRLGKGKKFGHRRKRMELYTKPTFVIS